MKNTIPMIIAVLLAAAAVFAVSRLIKPKDADAEKQFVEVVAASQTIQPDQEIQESWLQSRSVEVSSLPRAAIFWNQRNLAVGQKSVRSIAEGDYVCMSDVGDAARELDKIVREGEWAVPVTFADGALVQFLQPGMEISILGSFTMKDTIQKIDGTEKPEVVEHEATSVLFPRVRILDVGKGDGVRREAGEGRSGGTVIVALTPQQAMTLVAAQRTMELYPALRHRNDMGTLKRQDVGVVNETTFQNLKKNLETVVIPDGPEASGDAQRPDNSTRK